MAETRQPLPGPRRVAALIEPVGADKGIVAVPSARVIVLSPVEETVLTARARAARSEHRDVVRARIVLAAAAGAPNEAIAFGLGMCVDTVRKWRTRFAARGLPGLDDLPRAGRPRRFTPLQVAQVKVLACTLPAETGLPLSRWSGAELTAEVIARGLAESGAERTAVVCAGGGAEAVAATTVRRWLADDAIKPWQHRSWIFPRDPEFAVKAARVLDLYARHWQGEPLGDDDYVISADEKSQLKALRRRHPGLPPAPGRTRRVDFEYRRGGTMAYFAAYDVHRAHVIGQIAPRPASNPSPSWSPR